MDSFVKKDKTILMLEETNPVFTKSSILFKDESLLYIKLIDKAEVSYEKHVGYTYDEERDFKQKHIEEINSYNGYTSLGVFAARLKSLESLMELEIEYAHPYNKGFIDELRKLGSNFYFTGKDIKHRNYSIAENSKPIKHPDIFLPFIKKAHESITYLNSRFDVKSKFIMLFLGDSSTVIKNLEVIENALRDLNMTDYHGRCILGKKEIAKLWAFTDVLKDKCIISYPSEKELMAILWSYINGIGKAPTKPHREEPTFSIKKSNIENYFTKYFSQ